MISFKILCQQISMYIYIYFYSSSKKYNAFRRTKKGEDTGVFENINNKENFQEINEPQNEVQIGN